MWFCCFKLSTTLCLCHYPLCNIFLLYYWWNSLFIVDSLIVLNIFLFYYLCRVHMLPFGKDPGETTLYQSKNKNDMQCNFCKIFKGGITTLKHIVGGFCDTKVWELCLTFVRARSYHIWMKKRGKKSNGWWWPFRCWCW